MIEKDVPWNELYASLLQNTSLNMDDIMNMSLPALEYLMEGISNNNKKSETGNGEKPLEGAEAFEMIMSNGGKL